VDGETSSSISSGKTLHIQQNIVPHKAYGGFHNAEVLWYDPVIYLLEPADMTIERETFTFTTTGSDGSTSSQVIGYSKTPVSNATHLQSGYQLYKYA
jgi:hypothetical protein